MCARPQKVMGSDPMPGRLISRALNPPSALWLPAELLPLWLDADAVVQPSMLGQGPCHQQATDSNPRVRATISSLGP